MTLKAVFGIALALVGALAIGLHLFSPELMHHLGHASRRPLDMIRTLAFAAALVAFAVSASAQDKTVTTADFAGTWNIEVMSHQIALVIEPAEGNKVTATMMMMGRDTLLKGELADRTLTLVGIKTETSGAPEPRHAAHEPPSNATPIVVTLQEDGTIAGEMMTTGGAMKWTGEKLRARKKG